MSRYDEARELLEEWESEDLLTDAVRADLEERLDKACAEVERLKAALAKAERLSPEVLTRDLVRLDPAYRGVRFTTIVDNGEEAIAVQALDSTHMPLWGRIGVEAFRGRLDELLTEKARQKELKPEEPVPCHSMEVWIRTSIAPRFYRKGRWYYYPGGHNDQVMRGTSCKACGQDFSKPPARLRKGADAQ